MPSERNPSTLYALLLVLIVALVFLPGLSGDFLFDDYPNIVKEDRIHATELTTESISAAAGAYHGPIGRPVSTISFAIDHVFWGLDPLGYKITNLLVHVINAWLVFGLVSMLLPLSKAPVRWGSGAAAVLAALWALHPLQVSTVHYVVQRMEMLSALFVVLGLMSYLRGRLNQISGVRGWPWLAACLPLAVLATLAKESGILLPVYALALELTVLGFAAKQRSMSIALRTAYGLCAVIGVTVFLTFVLPTYGVDSAFSMREFGPEERLLTQLRALPTYLGWIILPQPASYVFYYDNYLASTGLLQPWTTLAGGLFIVSLLGFAVLVRRRLPLVALGIMWFFGAHLLSSNVFALELVFEHRNYFGLLGVLLALGELVRRVPLGDDPRIRTLTVAALLVGVVSLTLIRSATWGNSLNLALELTDKNPGSARASMDLGELYLQLARNDPRSKAYAIGMAELERGAGLPNSSPMPEQGLIVYSAHSGQPAKQEWWDSVVRKLETRAIGPQELTMIVDLLDRRREGLPIDDARFADAYMVLVNRIEMPATQYYAFGDHAVRYLGDEALASQLFRLAVEKSRDDPVFVASMVDTLLKEGFRDQAVNVADAARSSGVADIVLPPAPPSTPPEP